MKKQSVYAFFAIQPDGTETTIAVLKDNIWFPLFTSDEAVLPSMKKEAKLISEQTGKKIILLKFSHREEMPV